MFLKIIYAISIIIKNILHSKIETYVSQNENNISFKLNTYGKEYKKTSALTLASYQIDIPSVNKYNAFVKNFKIKVSGAKHIFLYRISL